MRTALLHLSDLHIASQDDFIIQELQSLANAIRYYINECERCVIVISGDIIDKGKTEYYEIAKQFLCHLKSALQEERHINIDFVIVPGNHDIDFSKDQYLRNLVITDLKCKDLISENKESSKETVLGPQQAFWTFYEEVTGRQSVDKLSQEIVFPIGNNCNIVFHCYNSAFLSTIDEEPQSLVIPEDAFLNRRDHDSGDFIVTVLHHSPSWLSTRTPKNNQKTFENHILCNSNLILCGHEHLSHGVTVSPLNHAKDVLYLEADSFKYGNAKEFNLLIIDESDNQKIQKIRFKYDGIHKFRLEDDSILPVAQERVGFRYKEEYLNFLSTLSLPIKHPRINNLTLQDVFVYPDLNPLSKDTGKSIYVYEDSSTLLDKIEDGHVYILEGNNQCGKTALLKQYVLDCQTYGFLPIWINGGDIANPNVGNLIKKSFKKQYSDSQKFDDYTAVNKDKRIIIIDNLDRSSLNEKGVEEMINRLLNNYKSVIITTRPNTDVKAIIRQSDSGSKFSYYQILSLGHLKRNEIIEKWFKLGIDTFKIHDVDLIDKIKITFNQISNLLQGDLLPAYPPFILTLLHGMSSMVESYDLAPTTYANLYHTLLLSTLNQVQVPQDRYNEIITFLSELAFEMYLKDEKEIGMRPNESKVNLEEFYFKYTSDRVLRYSVVGLSDLLSKSGILTTTISGKLFFSYKYLYYYLVGIKLSQLAHTKEGAKHITNLCNTINQEESANILIFLAYLIKRPVELLDEIRLTNQIPLNDVEPISLRLDDPLVGRLTSLLKTLRNDSLRTDVNYKEEREKLLKAKDEEERRFQILESNNIEDESNNSMEELDEAIIEITTILKSIKVMGQIVKNQRGTLTKTELRELVKDSYLSSFRLIGQFTNNLESDFSSIVDEICNINNINIDNRIEIENHISKTFTSILFRICLDVFTNLALSVGTTELQEIYNSVADEIKSPAADLISFTINSYFGPFKIESLKKMVKEYKNNPVVMSLIQARVRHYVYHHNLPYDAKQQMAQISGLKLIKPKALLK